MLDKRLAAQLVVRSEALFMNFKPLNSPNLMTIICVNGHQVTYCETEKKGEVLQLMAGMMVRLACFCDLSFRVALCTLLTLSSCRTQGFSEEQKRRVGLGFPIDGNGGGGLFSSILGFVAPANSGNGSTTTPADLEGKSFADIWTEFLIDEAAKK